MTFSVDQADAGTFSWESEDAVPAGMRRVIASAAETDGRAPLNEQTLLWLRHSGLAGASLWVADTPTGMSGFALADAPPGAERVEVNLVVAPVSRSTGAGTALAAEVLAAFPEAAITAWSHGNHPGAAALARKSGLERVRDLWVMRRPLGDAGDGGARAPLPPSRHKITAEPSQSSAEPSESFTRRGPAFEIRTFQPGRDEEAFLELNARAFAGHPEQGTMTRADLDQRMAEPWFDPAGFFLAVPTDPNEGGGLLGFHWTKVHHDEPAYGEVYVVGVSPYAQGMGLGRTLTLAGLHHLRSLGLGEVILYVEGDNAAAVAVYEKLGFTHADSDTDVMYAR